MILVDTSAWISFFSRSPSARAGDLRDRLTGGERVAITGMIMQEVLQGSRSPAEFARLRSYLVPQRILQPRHSVLTFVEAARIYAQCRWAGITIRSSIDCLIAQIAIEHHVALFHDDQDFEHMSTIIPKLILA